MIKFVRKNRKEIIIGAIVMLVLFGIYYVQSALKVTKSIEKDIPNNDRSEESLTDTFYSDQLSDVEKENFNLLEERIQDKQGGVVEFTEALTGFEYLRIMSAVTNQSGNYFYGIFDIPMTRNDVCVSYKNSDLTEVEDAVIVKSILFVLAAKGINEQGDYASDGTVKNLKEIEQGLKANDEDKAAAIEKKQAETETILNQIVSEIPSGYGEKETVDYFLKWMDNHLTFHSDVGTKAASFSTMEEIFDGVYIYMNTACVTEGKAAALGYVKVLSELCNRAGMESHTVMGSWGTSGQSAYVLCEVTIGGEEIYIDASGAKGNDLSGQKYLSAKEAKEHLVFANYFDYQ